MTAAERITVADKMLVHMSIYKKGFDEYCMPSILTQDGIADVLGLSRAHVSVEMKTLSDKGFVNCGLAHVAGFETKKKVYTLTPEGFDAAEAAKKKVGCGISIEEVLSRKKRTNETIEEAFRLVLKSAVKLSRLRNESKPDLKNVETDLLDALKILCKK